MTLLVLDKPAALTEPGGWCWWRVDPKGPNNVCCTTPRIHAHDVSTLAEKLDITSGCPRNRRSASRHPRAASAASSSAFPQPASTIRRDPAGAKGLVKTSVRNYHCTASSILPGRSWWLEPQSPWMPWPTLAKIAGEMDWPRRHHPQKVRCDIASVALTWRCWC